MTIYNILFLLINKFIKKQNIKTMDFPAAIKVEGIIKDSRIIGNEIKNATLLQAKEIDNSEVVKNIVNLPLPKDLPLPWRIVDYLISVFLILLVLYIAYLQYE